MLYIKGARFKRLVISLLIICVMSILAISSTTVYALENYCKSSQVCSLQATPKLTKVEGIEKFVLISRSLSDQQLVKYYTDLKKEGFVLEKIDAYVVSTDRSRVFVVIYKFKDPGKGLEKLLIYAINPATGTRLVILADAKASDCFWCAIFAGACVACAISCAGAVTAPECIACLLSTCPAAGCYCSCCCCYLTGNSWCCNICSSCK